MNPRNRGVALRGVAVVLCACAAVPLHGQDMDHDGMEMQDPTPHAMWSTSLGAGWRLLGMAQAFPVITWGAPGKDGTPLRATEVYLTQPAVMADLASPDARWLVRTTLNFEGLTLPDGELTSGGWGEGFIDKRHPHTLLHELMVTWTAWDGAGGGLSLSVGKGFAPYGTDDPMARPGLKYPTNHHLSQILERWTVNGAWLAGNWSVEAGVFGGGEPEGPWDLGNVDSFADSWSGRVARRWGRGSGPSAEWEASASYGDVAEHHEAEVERTRLGNVALRWNGGAGGRRFYALAEASRNWPEHGEGVYSLLAEARLHVGKQQPYVRIEGSTRPEYPRYGGDDEGFFRYDHDAESVGSTQWLIITAAWAMEATGGPLGVRPFVEAQYHRVGQGRGGIDPDTLLGTTSFWGLSAGGRVFLGGGPMRMGAYGVLDPMAAMARMPANGGMPEMAGR